MAVGVILRPSGRRPRLLLPPGMAREQGPLVGVCKVVVKRDGTLCGQVFHKGQEGLWERHCTSCAIGNLDLIREMAPSHANKGTIFAHERRDREVEAHMRRLKGKMLSEGRYEVKSSERAGM